MAQTQIAGLRLYLAFFEDTAGGGMRAVPQLCILYPGICRTTEENH